MYNIYTRLDEVFLISDNSCSPNLKSVRTEALLDTTKIYTEIVAASSKCHSTLSHTLKITLEWSMYFFLRKVSFSWFTLPLWSPASSKGDSCADVALEVLAMLLGFFFHCYTKACFCCLFLYIKNPSRTPLHFPGPCFQKPEELTVSSPNPPYLPYRASLSYSSLLWLSNFKCTKIGTISSSFFPLTSLFLEIDQNTILK